MPITSELVGTVLPAVTTTWTSLECNLYALAIGAGQQDPMQDLSFTTSRGQQVYPTFGAIVGARSGVGGMLDLLGDGVDFTKMLHGEEKVEQLAPLPSDATVVTSGHISAIWDKGTSTVVETVVDTTDAETGRTYSRTTAAMFFRGVGGWGGERGPSTRAILPERAPDRVLTATTRPDQALLYRLTGDQNPLHVDPEVAAAAGFPRPILHGMCVYGVVGRVLGSAYADADPTRFRSLAARFSKPTMPGDALTISCWEEPGQVTFAVANQNGDIVMNNGRFAHTAGAS